MNQKLITILHLYPRDMNIYGDFGNILVLKRRLEWSGYKVEVVEYNQGDDFPTEVDLIVGGGGQDSGQNKIQTDLMLIEQKLRKLAEANIPMLMICGLYQLFGKFFETSSGDTIKGVGILDVETFGKPERLIGNIIVDSPEFGEIIGYENHSGQTFLGRGAKPLGQVRVGAGNNMTDGTEGARYKNVIGSYLHGSLLPKNPNLADFLIEQAVINKYGEFEPQVIDDRFAKSARSVAFRRPR